eukprot:scaffold66753_cov16-Tisochrysis_lutea.AAC.1
MLPNLPPGSLLRGLQTNLITKDGMGKCMCYICRLLEVQACSPQKGYTWLEVTYSACPHDPLTCCRLHAYIKASSQSSSEPFDWRHLAPAT